MNDWSLVFENFDPRQEGLREALCTLGNGYFATRGAAAHAHADEVHYPGTYLAGGYNRLTSVVGGREVENEDLVNMPNWLALTLRINGGAWFELRRVELIEYRQVLDLRHGILERVVLFEHPQGLRTRLCERRLVHMEQSHLAAIEMTVSALNWSGTLEVESALDGNVVNTGVARYRALRDRHLELIETSAPGAEHLYLKVRTIQSRLEVALAARTTCHREDSTRRECSPSYEIDGGRVAQRFGISLQAGETVRVEKVVSLYTSRDAAISECGLAARQAVERAAGFKALDASHALRWEQLWRRFDIGIEEEDRGSERTEMILRLHIFHLLQTASPHSMDLDVGVPARGWHGEAYRGHIFWDELFIFPLLNWRLPEITRALLMYRYRRLDEARENAREAGYRGAMYPWQSGSSGREETQRLHLNPRSGRWLPDNTQLQRHINAAIAYNIWQYYQATGDVEFMSFHGAEMFLEIARFWGSFAAYNAGLDRYEIRGVVGPDEFHTAYPDREQPGLDNHSYTSVMAAWVLGRACDLLELLPDDRRTELRESLHLRDDELAHWDQASRRMRVVFHHDGVISQFEGYENLRELDWAGYRRKYGDIHRLDRLLEAEGDSVNRYKAAKQADVLMLFYLFSSEQLAALFARLGYAFDHDTIPRNVAYYASRTSHGSTLSRVVDSWVTARSDREGTWRVFKQALESDVADIQGGTTAEGIHLGAMAGTVDLLQRGYTGIVTRGDTLWLDPCLPQALRCLRMTVRYRGHALDLTITQQSLTVHAQPANATPITVGVVDQIFTFEAGQVREFNHLPQRRAGDYANPESPGGNRPV